MDEQLGRWIVRYRPGWLSDTAEIVTLLGTLGASAVIIVVGTLIRRTPRRLVAVALTGLLVDHLLVRLTKSIVERARPPASWQLIDADGFAMPSGHAANAAFTGLVLWWLLPRRWRWTGVVLTVAVAATRLVLGVHWASDVIVGVLFGGAIGVLVAQLGRRSARQIA